MNAIKNTLILIGVLFVAWGFLSVINVNMHNVDCTQIPAWNMFEVLK